MFLRLESLDLPDKPETEQPQATTLAHVYIPPPTAMPVVTDMLYLLQTGEPSERKKLMAPPPKKKTRLQKIQEKNKWQA